MVYAGSTAARLGRRVGIVTAGGIVLSGDAALADAAVASLPSDATTTFEFRAGPTGRTLRVLERAPRLTESMVPPAWRTAEILHLAPIADELPIDVAMAFPATTIFGTLQGWLRSIAADGSIRPEPRRALDLPLDCFAAVVVSAEDLACDAEITRGVASRVPVLVLTRGSDGCSLYQGPRLVDVPAIPAEAVDTTGAGDVFAAAFFIRLVETDDPLESARFASCAAALSVEGYGTSAIPTREAIAARLA